LLESKAGRQVLHKQVESKQHAQPVLPKLSWAPVSSEISDQLLFVSYFASLSKGIKYGDYFFDVCCVI